MLFSHGVEVGHAHAVVDDVMTCWHAADGLPEPRTFDGRISCRLKSISQENGRENTVDISKWNRIALMTSLISELRYVRDAYKHCTCTYTCTLHDLSYVHVQIH